MGVFSHATASLLGFLFLETFTLLIPPSTRPRLDCMMAWAPTAVLLTLVVYNSFPVREEGKYIVSTSSFWGPNPLLNFAPCLLRSVCPSHSTCFPSHFLSIALMENTQSIRTGLCCLNGRKPRGQGSPPLSCGQHGRALRERWGTSAAPHF